MAQLRIDVLEYRLHLRQIYPSVVIACLLDMLDDGLCCLSVELLYFSFDLSDPTIALLHAGEGSRADDGGALSRGERWLFERTHQ